MASFLLALTLLSPLASSTPLAAANHTNNTSVLPLFDYETRQLTQSFLDNLAQDDQVFQHISSFSFDSERPLNLSSQPRCKVLPGDKAWPEDSLWALFDELIGGALSPIIPLASTCYPNSTYQNYNAERCAQLISTWDQASTHADDPGSVFSPLYEGNTCFPSANPTSSTCTQGGFSSYSVNVSTVAQIQLAVNFARTQNLRLVVKNTGHDYNARSTGKGALSIWMHNLKEIRFVPEFKGFGYEGPVTKVGAGVQGIELYEEAEKHGVSAVGGICPSVGVAGGYILGGGHSPLMQHYGMGADQVLSLEIVLASGKFTTATPSHNPDLYWAVLGGGGGTFGIVTSATLKVHPKIHVTTSVFSFSTSANISTATFWTAIKAFWDEFPVYNAAKTYSYFWLLKLGDTYLFTMNPFFATNKTIAEYETLTRPFFSKLEALNIPYVVNTTHHSSFLPAYKSTFGSLEFYIGSVASIPGNRILPRQNWDNESISNATFSAVRNAVELSGAVGLYHQNPATQISVRNSVNPAFRNEAGMLIAAYPVHSTNISALKIAGQTLTNEVLGPLRRVTPDGGAYGNEAEIGEPEWQDAFWGEGYGRLLRIKREWDPMGLFYNWHGVGSEGWVVEDGEMGVQTQDGRLCRI